MLGWQRLCKTEDVVLGLSKKIEISGFIVMVAHIESGFFVVDATCPHMGGDLSMGKIVGGSVICPRHGSTYDLATGKMLKDVGGAIRFLTRKGAADIRSYPVKIENGSVLVNLE
jgi:3-phenylpropionate/trans-cinnamate dioxygenase ferredoxin subunit